MKVKIGGYPNYRFYHNWLYDWFGYSPKQKTSIRIGTAAETTRGHDEMWFRQLAHKIADILE